jgi:hypothetical protein
MNEREMPHHFHHRRLPLVMEYFFRFNIPAQITLLCAMRVDKKVCLRFGKLSTKKKWNIANAI